MVTPTGRSLKMPALRLSQLRMITQIPRGSLRRQANPPNNRLIQAGRLAWKSGSCRPNWLPARAPIPAAEDLEVKEAVDAWPGPLDLRPQALPAAGTSGCDRTRLVLLPTARRLAR